MLVLPMLLVFVAILLAVLLSMLPMLTLCVSVVSLIITRVLFMCVIYVLVLLMMLVLLVVFVLFLLCAWTACNVVVSLATLVSILIVSLIPGVVNVCYRGYGIVGNANVFDVSIGYGVVFDIPYIVVVIVECCCVVDVAVVVAIVTHHALYIYIYIDYDIGNDCAECVGLRVDTSVVIMVYILLMLWLFPSFLSLRSVFLLFFYLFVYNDYIFCWY